MSFRLKAFGLHLLASAAVLSVVLGTLYTGWYRFPGWYLAAAVHIVVLLVAVDLMLGPTLTLCVAHPRKLRRVLARDIAVIVTVQSVALVYGAATLWLGRPLYYTFSVDRLELVQASDLKADRGVAPAAAPLELAPHWYSLPRWVWAPLPEDPAEATRIVAGTLSGGADVIQQPRYFRPWRLGLSQLAHQLRSVDEWQYFSRSEKQTLRSRMARGGMAVERNTLILWGGGRRVLVVFDRRTLAVRAMLRAD